jgi:DNA-directed RNA polymerase subunit K/omega
MAEDDEISLAGSEIHSIASDDENLLENQLNEALEGDGDDYNDFIDVNDDLDKQELDSSERNTGYNLTKYEIARLIGTRAQMIANGSPKTISNYPKGASPREIAELELRAGKCPLTIRRWVGRSYEDCDSNALFLNLRQLY